MDLPSQSAAEPTTKAEGREVWAAEPVLQIRGLRTHFFTESGAFGAFGRLVRTSDSA